MKLQDEWNIKYIWQVFIFFLKVFTNGTLLISIQTSKALNFRPQFIQIALDQQLLNEHFNLILKSVINVIGFRQMWSRVNYFYVKLLPSETCVGCKTSHKSIGDLLGDDINRKPFLNMVMLLRMQNKHTMMPMSMTRRRSTFNYALAATETAASVQYAMRPAATSPNNCEDDGNHNGTRRLRP